MTGYLKALVGVILTVPAVAEPLVETLVDVGGYRLNFQVSPGAGMPILFESGGGDDGSVWTAILQPLSALTGATLITYDRAGFGRSEIDTSQHGIVNGIIGLERGLKRLGYSGDIMLVAHSLGGFYATLYASRNSQRVKVAVLIDANHVCFFTADQLRNMRNSAADLERYKQQSLGRYYLAVDFEQSVEVMRRTPFPPDIPVLNIVADRTLFDGTPDADRWRACHKQFISASPSRKELVALASGHYVFKQSPELVVMAIADAYAAVIEPAKRVAVLERLAAMQTDALNRLKKRETDYRHSEADLNEWGYALMRRGDTAKALAVFQLAASIYPESGNAHDSLAECYEIVGDRDAAVRHYRRALELAADKKHARERLSVLAPE